MNIKEYHENSFSCPYCGSSNLEGMSFDPTSSCVYQDVKCHNCGALWSDRYELTGIDGEDDSYLDFLVPDEVERKRHKALLCIEKQVSIEILGHTFYITVVDGVPVVLEKE